ncbi:MAG: divalent-cation tolerance protein CutA [Candidatus Micrarchaeota archaeon]|nr:divalent-cation tolerance protein CutA [Candidatus Micrarchaeota archaeon]
MILIITTSQDPELGRKLVERKVVACASRDEVTSVYWWKGKMEEEKEYRFFLKTTEEKKEEAIKALKELHDYEVPEILVIKAEANPEYLEWMQNL